MGKKSIMSTDRIVGVSAIVISLATLTVLIFQTNLMHEQRRQSVFPYLMIGNYGTNTPDFKIVLENKGVGPALIESVKVNYQDSTYLMDLPNFLYQNIKEMDSISNIYHSNIFEGYLIKPGEQIPILQIDNSLQDATKLLNVFRDLQQNGNLGFEIVFKSIYDEKWVLTDRDATPRTIN